MFSLILASAPARLAVSLCLRPLSFPFVALVPPLVALDRRFAAAALPLLLLDSLRSNKKAKCKQEEKENRRGREDGETQRAGYSPDKNLTAPPNRCNFFIHPQQVEKSFHAVFDINS